MNSESSLSPKILVFIILAVAGYLLYRNETSAARSELRAKETVGLMSSQDILSEQLHTVKMENKIDLITNGRTTVISTGELRRKELLRQRQAQNLDQILGAYEESHNANRAHSREMDNQRRRLANEQYEQLEHSNDHLIKSGQQGGAQASNTLHLIHQENARRDQAETMNWADISSRAAIQNMQNAQAQHDMEVQRAEAEAEIAKAQNELGPEEEESTLGRWMREGIVAVAGYMLYSIDHADKKDSLRASETLKMMSSEFMLKQQLMNVEDETEVDIISDGRTTVIGTSTMRRREMLRSGQAKNLELILDAHGTMLDQAREHSKEMDDIRRRMANEQYEQLENSNHHVMKSGQEAAAHASNTFHMIHQEGARRQQAEAMNWANISSRVAIQCMQNAQTLHDMETQRAEATAEIAKAQNELDANA